MLSFKCTSDELAIVRKISRRARALLLGSGIDRDAVSIQMDLLATHANGMPLRFADLLAADAFNLMHDLGGIAKHLDRKTGKLGGCFRPRFSVPASKA